MRLQGLAKGGYYPTPDRVVDLLCEKLRGPNSWSTEKGFRILDPCAGTGAAIARMSEYYKSFGNMLDPETFGIELQEERSTQADKALDNVLASDLFNTSIANRAFSLLFLNPPYDWDADEGEKRVEQSFLSHCTRYLIDDGILVFIVPKHRLTYSTRYLATHYFNIKVYEFPPPEYDLFDQVVVIAKRRGWPNYEQSTDQYLDELIHGRAVMNRLGAQDDYYGRYHIPAVPEGDVMFNSRLIDPVAATKDAQENGLWVDKEIREVIWPREERRVQPLMPLRRGHLAMLTAAGLLDNLVLEGADRTVIVKGRATKMNERVSSDKDKEVWREQLVTSVVAIDLATGEFQTISA